MSKKIDRTGEKGINNFGSEMIIIRYRTNKDVDIYFPEYNWTARNTRYDVFKNGEIVCPYERRVFSVSYLGEGKYNVHDKNGKLTKCYTAWHAMMQRCYDSECHKRLPTYIDCEVCEEWHNFQNFGDWFKDNYYEIEGQKMHLDKDILNKGNKIYSPENCIFAPEKINTLFVKSNKARGDYPIGVHYHKQHGKFQAYCSVYNYEKNKKKQIHLGYYDTPQKAFEVYKQFKEQYIKQVADYYKDLIPNKLYDALYNYVVEITD